MLKQRTLNIINILKGNTKYHGLYDGTDGVEAVKQYMADECKYNVEWYTDADMFEIMYDAMLDYLDHCDKPSFFMEYLKDVMDRRTHDMYYSIALVFRAYTQVCDDDGNYVNGFDDRIHALDEEEIK
jgi:hypothetical protein